MERVGFVGVGRMGLPLVASLRRKGFDPLLFDVSAERRRELEAAGFRFAESGAALAAASDIVLTMLPGPAEVLEAVLGPRGILAHLRRGAMLVEMSTVDPATTDRISQAAEKAGIAM